MSSSLFEGRDAAGKGGVIKRIVEPLNPRFCRVAALGTPTERERTQWYFQRYVAHLPAAGEIVLFDRSWYNRAGVERVMGFCTDDELTEFFRVLPRVRADADPLGHHPRQVLVLGQRRGAGAPLPGRGSADPTKNWKLSPMDLESRARWVDYSRAKDEMFRHTDTKQSPWWVVDADDKPTARLNCIHHLLSMIPYSEPASPQLELPPRQDDVGYVRPPVEQQSFVPSVY